MPTQETVRHQYSHSSSSLMELMLDPDCVRARCEHFRDRDIVVSVSEQDNAVKVQVERQSSLNIPAFIRPLINPSARVRESCTWSPVEGGWRGDYEVDAEGVPGKIRGHTWLKANDAGCLFESSFEVSASVPVLGKRIEKLVASEFAKGLLDGVEVYLAKMVSRHRRSDPDRRGCGVEVGSGATQDMPKHIQGVAEPRSTSQTGEVGHHACVGALVPRQGSWP